MSSLFCAKTSRVFDNFILLIYPDLNFFVFTVYHYYRTGKLKHTCLRDHFMALHASILYSAIFGLLYIYLSAEVTKLRLKYQIWLGYGKHLDLFKAIRIHGNFIEYVPFTLFLLFLSELIGGRSWMIHTLGGVLVVARILHIIGLRMTEGPSLYRFFGTTLTWAVMLIFSIFCLVSAF